MKRNLVDTATAISLTRWSQSSLARRVRAGAVTRYQDPRDHRRALYDWDELVKVAYPGADEEPPVAYDLEGLAVLRFAEVMAAYEDGDMAAFRSRLHATPANLTPHLLELAVVLAHNAIEDDVTHATEEQKALARIRAHMED